MWGSSFSEFAKKAAELQEQAAHSIQDSMTSPSGVGSYAASGASGFFNMDGLQQTEEREVQKIPNKQKMAQYAADAMESNNNNNNSNSNTTASPLQLKTPTVTIHKKAATPNGGTLLVVPPPQHRTPNAPLTVPARPVVVVEKLETKASNDSGFFGEDDQPEATATATEPKPTPTLTPPPPQEEENEDNDDNDDGWQEDDDDDDFPVEEAAVEEAPQVEDVEDDDQAALERAWKERQLELQRQTEPKAVSPPQPEVPFPEDKTVSPTEQETTREKPAAATFPMEPPTPVRMDHDDAPAPSPPAPEPQTAVEPPPPPANEAQSQLPLSSAAAPPKSNSNAPTIPEHVYQQFSDQLQRLEENHHAELVALQQELAQQQTQHQNALAHEQQQRQEAQQLVQQRSMDWSRNKEGYTLQLDALQHELEGTKQLLETKGKEGRVLQETHLHQLRDMEKQMNRKGEESKGNAQQVRELQKSLEDSQSALEASKDEYDTLKGRVKVVAGELKERRIECRTLQSEVDRWISTNQTLQDTITHLKADGMDRNKSTKEIEDELNALRGQLMDTKVALTNAQAAIAAGTQKGDEALSAYKKKAQQSLSLANARIAAAVQAKEDAEMEARAARSTADSAMGRVLVAERNGKEALAEAKAYVSDMEQDVKNYNQVKDALETASAQLAQVTRDAETYQETNDTLKGELQQMQGRLEAEQITSQEVRDGLGQAENRTHELYEEVERLRKEGQRLKDDLQRVRTEANTEDTTAEPNKTRASSSFAEKHNSVAETTIAMLQHELQDANQAIKELKETLISAVEEQAAPSGAPSTNGDTGGMPLFYAMEKQAELTQARNEIARLANLVGNAESSKQEAMDAMEDMHLTLEESQAKLKRQEQSEQRSPEQERVNLEYLKNIVLSYLNAKTIPEKKALLPVMGAVLCWTPEETRRAIDALDTTVSSSLLGKLNWS